jgi:hypothetical protein
MSCGAISDLLPGTLDLLILRNACRPPSVLVMKFA